MSVRPTPKCTRRWGPSPCNGAAAGFEFTCGPQDARKVLVEYASPSMVLRGLELK